MPAFHVSYTRAGRDVLQPHGECIINSLLPVRKIGMGEKQINEYSVDAYKTLGYMNRPLI